MAEERKSSQWGGRPVDLRRMTVGGLRRSVPAVGGASGSPGEAEQGVGQIAGVRELLRLRGKAQQLAVAAALLADQDRPRVVVIGSSAHAVGSSSLAAAMSMAVKRHVAIIDAHALDLPGAADRLGVSATPWSSVAATDAPGVRQRAREVGAFVSAESDAAKNILVLGSTTGWSYPSPEILAAVTLGFASAHRELIIVELPPGAEAAAAFLPLLPATATPLVVWASRNDAAELRRAARDLRQVQTKVPAIDLSRAGVLAITTMHERAGRAVAAASTVATDTLAGRVTAAFDPALVPSNSPLPHPKPEAAGTLLAACSALT